MHLSRVSVRAEYCEGGDLTARAAEIWRLFEACVPGHPLAGIPVEFGPAWPERIFGLAICGIPSLDEPAAQVLLSEDLLGEGIPEVEQVLSLLHEAIHLQIMSAGMRRTRRVDDLLRRMSYELSARTSGLNGQFQWHQGHIARSFLTFPDEVWAELSLKLSYPDWFGRRMDYYTDMREGNVSKGLPGGP